MNENEKQLEQTSDNRATNSTNEIANEIQSLPSRFSPFCRSDCMICNSGHLSEIHEWRPTMTFRELSEKIKNEFQLSISKDQLWRHFKNFNQQLTGQIVKHMESFDLQVETLTEHQHRVLFLGKIAFDQILDRINAGTLQFSLDDYEKIMKLFYNTLRDPSAAQTDSQAMFALFQKAASRGGAPLEQGVLISFPQQKQAD